MPLVFLFIFSGISLVVWGALLLLSMSSQTSYVLSAGTIAVLPVYLLASGILARRARACAYDLLPYFLGSVFLFFCINIVLWPFASQTPFEFYSLISEVIDYALLARSAALLGLSLSIMLIAYGFSLPRRSSISFSEKNVGLTTRILAQLGFVLMLCSFPVMLYRLYQEYSYIANAGYLALYSEVVSSEVDAAWTAPFTYIFYTGFGLVCAFVVDQRKFTIAMTMFLVAALLDGLKGARGAVIVPILYCWWFYNSRFGVRIRLGRIGFYAIAGLALFIVITILRDEEGVNGVLVQFVIDTIATQGRSLQLTAIFLEKWDEISKYGNFMVASNLMIPINAFLHPELRGIPQSFDQVLYSNNLKHILTYTLNPDYYFAGGGTGGVYLVELVEAGIPVFCGLSALLGWFFARWPHLMRYPFPRYLSVQVFSAVFYMPRAEFFPNLLIMGKASVVFLILICATRVVVRACSEGQSIGEGRDET